MRYRDIAPCFSHPLFLGEYIEDIVQCLFEKENTRITFHSNSPQIEYRNLLVDFMEHFAENRGFRRTTLHLGVYLLDIFMDNHQIELVRLNIVSLVCLIIGAKVEEMDASIPNLPEITQLTNVDCKIEDYICLETMILTFFEWNVIQPTVVTFIELYIDAIISEEDFFAHCSQVTDGILYKDFKSMKLAATTIILQYLNTTLLNVHLCHVTPSKLAAAIVAATRCILVLNPVWSPTLVKITGYALDKLEPLISVLFSIKNADESKVVEDKEKSKSTPDSGYISSKDADTDDEQDSSEDQIDDLAKRFKT